MNPDLDRLQPYPFERLASLFADVEAPRDRRELALSIGEPKHAPPRLATEAYTETAAGLANYPAMRGQTALRSAIAAWLGRRFDLDAIDPESEILPVNGTREALFSFAQAVVDRSANRPVVLLPNPFYQIYEGAAVLAGAEAVYYPLGADGQPDFDTIREADWRSCQLLYICNPGNPTGAVLDDSVLRELTERARTYDFVIAADECYAEIYSEGHAPPGLLEASSGAGEHRFPRCIAFHSLSKRSNLPGLRSGFVAGDAAILSAFERYRTYHGCAMAPPAQAASIAAWNDEAHVVANRAAYQAKFDAVVPLLADVLELERPSATFYLWPRTPVNDETFARELFAREGVRVLPGRYLGRDTCQGNPAAGRVRMALVADQDDCIEAAHRIRRVAAALSHSCDHAKGDQPR
jgi:N-succinyldiaminopimelate aminotransferase